MSKRKRITLGLLIATLGTFSARAEIPDLPAFNKAVTIQSNLKGLPLESVLESLIKAVGYTPVLSDIPKVQIKGSFKNLPFRQTLNLLLSVYAENLDSKVVGNKMIVVAPKSTIDRISPQTESVAGEKPGPATANPAATAPVEPTNVQLPAANNEQTGSAPSMPATDNPPQVRFFDPNPKILDFLGVLKDLQPQVKFYTAGNVLLAQGSEWQLQETQQLIDAYLSTRAQAENPGKTTNTTSTQSGSTPSTLPSHDGNPVTQVKFFEPNPQITGMQDVLKSLLPQVKFYTVGDVLIAQGAEDQILQLESLIERSLSLGSQITLDARVNPSGLKAILDAVGNIRYTHLSSSGKILVSGNNETLNALETLLADLKLDDGIQVRTVKLRSDPNKINAALAQHPTVGHHTSATLGLIVLTGEPAALASAMATLETVNPQQNDTKTTKNVRVVLALQGDDKEVSEALKTLGIKFLTFNTSRTIVLEGTQQQVDDATDLLSIINQPSGQQKTVMDVLPLDGNESEIKGALDKLASVKYQLIGSQKKIILMGSQPDVEQAKNLLSAINVAVKPPEVNTLTVDVKASLSDVTVALQSIEGLSVKVLKDQNKILLQGSQATLNQAQKVLDTVNVPAKANTAAETTQYFPLNVDASDVLSTFRTFEPDIKISVLEKSQLIIVKGTPGQLQTASDLLSRINVSKTEVEKTAPQTVTLTYPVLGDGEEIVRAIKNFIPGVQVEYLQNGEKLVVSATEAQQAKIVGLLSQINVPLSPDAQVKKADPKSRIQKVYPLNYADASSIAKSLETILKAQNPQPSQVQPATNNATTTPATTQNATLPELSIVPDTRTNSLVVIGSPNQVAQFEKTLVQLDIPTPQVNLKVRIERVNSGALDQLGVDWKFNVGGFSVGGGKSGLSSSVGNGINAMLGWNLKLDALHKAGQSSTVNNSVLRVKSNTSTSVKDGGRLLLPKTSSTSSGTETNSYESFNYGLEIQLTPKISPDGTIDLTIETSFGGKPEDGPRGGILINEQTMKSQLSFANGETIVLGGLISKEKSTSQSGVPLLMNIPILGNLFKWTEENTSETSLVIFITGEIDPLKTGPGMPKSSTETPSPAVVSPDDQKKIDEARKTIETDFNAGYRENNVPVGK